MMGQLGKLATCLTHYLEARIPSKLAKSDHSHFMLIKEEEDSPATQTNEIARFQSFD